MKQQMQTSILDTLATSILVLDSGLHVRYMNAAAEVLLDASQKHLLSRAVDGWLFTSSEEVAALRSVLGGAGSFTRRESRLMISAGQVVTVDYSVNPLNLSGELSLLLEIQARDRLLRIEREEEQQAHHDAARQLIRGMAHEIKNPLGGIRGAAQLLERELTAPEMREYTQVIIDESDRLRKLVDRLLGPDRMPECRVVNIHSIIERVCSLVYAECHGSVVLIRDYDPSIPELIGDAEQLMQALLNVVRNALQALSGADNQAPTITLRTRTRRQVTLGSRQHRLICSVEVVDNGPGVPSALQNTLFYPMISGRAEGSGLGLSIAQSIIHQHGGVIELISKPGETCFSLLLPLE